MKKTLIVALIACALAVSAYAGPQAIVGGIKGKVETKGLQGGWAPATEGMKLDLRSTISTGFDSTATLTIDKSTIVVKPLTRLSIDKLVEQSSGSVAASMFLRVGSVQTKVKAATPGTPQDFKVQSPYSTASVRGTFWYQSIYGVRVLEGSVHVLPGRPLRDIDDPTGFDGVIDVGAADQNAGVIVRQNQEVKVFPKYTMDTGSSSPDISQTGSSGKEGSASDHENKPGSGTQTGKVTIFVTAD